MRFSACEFLLTTLCSGCCGAIYRQMWLEMEIGITGGEEDGVDNSGADPDKLYTQPEQVGCSPVRRQLACHLTKAPRDWRMLHTCEGDGWREYSGTFFVLKPRACSCGLCKIPKYQELPKLPLIALHGIPGAQIW